MMTWLILTAANILKGSIVGGLALLSWGIHTFGPDDARVYHVYRAAGPADLTVVVACTDGDDAALEAKAEALVAAHAGLVARHLAKLSKHIALLRLGEIVPPIRVEAIYSPDMLLPPSVLLAPPPLPPTAAAPTPAVSRAT